MSIKVWYITEDIELLVKIKVRLQQQLRVVKVKIIFILSAIHIHAIGLFLYPQNTNYTQESQMKMQGGLNLTDMDTYLLHL